MVTDGSLLLQYISHQKTTAPLAQLPFAPLAPGAQDLVSPVLCRWPCLGCFLTSAQALIPSSEQLGGALPGENPRRGSGTGRNKYTAWKRAHMEPWYSEHRLKVWSMFRFQINCPGLTALVSKECCWQ